MGTIPFTPIHGFCYDTSFDPNFDPFLWTSFLPISGDLTMNDFIDSLVTGLAFTLMILGAWVLMIVV